MPQRRIPYIVLVIGVLITGPLHAQRNREREYPIAPLAITDREAAIGTEVELKSQEQSREGSDTDTELKSSLFEEYVRYRLRGYAYHPRLLDIDASFKLGLAQIESERSGPLGDESRSSDATLEEWDLRLLFLKEHPVSLYLMTRREETPVIGFFTDHFLVETETQRVGLNWKNRNFPMSLSYTRRDLTRHGGDSETDSLTEILEYNLKHYFGGTSRSEFRYINQSHEQKVVAGEDDERGFESTFESDEVSLINTTYLSPDKRSNVTSLFRYFDQSLEQDVETFHWRERLQLQHTEKLRTYYQGSVLQNEIRAREIDTYRLEAGINHLLYRSLESHLDIHWREMQDELIVEREYGATGSLNYRKTTPWGILSAHYLRTIDQFEREGEQRDIPVVNEVHALTTNGVRFLSNRNVVQSSIRVTDLARQRTYAAGFDYAVVQSGDRTGLRILPGGELNDNDSVAVDYRYQTEFNFEYISDTEEFAIRHDFVDILDGLALYARYHDLTPRDSNDEDRRLLEFEDRLVGMQLDWRPFRWTEEYEEHRSNFDSWDQLRSQLEFSHALRPNVRFTANAGVNYTQYDEIIPGTDEDESIAKYLVGRLDGRVFRTGTWSLQARAEDEDGRIDQTLYGILGRLAFDWRKTTFELAAEYDVREFNETERDNVAIYLQIERRW